MTSEISYLNKILQACSRRGEPTHYASMLVLMAIQSKMRNATKTSQGKLWACVHPMIMQHEIAMEDKDYEEALSRLQRIGVIQLRMLEEDPPWEEESLPYACLTAKGLRKLRATGWGQYPKSRRETVNV